MSPWRGKGDAEGTANAPEPSVSVVVLLTDPVVLVKTGFDVLAVNLPQWECCLSPPCSPRPPPPRCSNASSPLHQDQQSENQSVTRENTRTQIHTPPETDRDSGREEKKTIGAEKEGVIVGGERLTGKVGAVIGKRQPRIDGGGGEEWYVNGR